MTAPVYHTGPGGLDDAGPGAEVALTGPEARHATTVRRTRPGEVVDLVDGQGRRARGTVTAADKERLVVTVEEVRDEPRPTVRLVLVQALAKGGRDEQAVETATEVGVDGVIPWQAGRSVAVWAGAKVERGRQRWAAVALSAAKQSRRATVPDIGELVGTGALAARCAEVAAAGGAAIVLHEEATTPLSGLTLPDPALPAGEVLVVVGPEGGITPQELTELTQAGARTARIGPHVLRTSTAGPVALALLADHLGRWVPAR